MATISKQKGNYYSRITWYDSDDIRHEKKIALKTKLKSEAVVRNNEVTNKEDVIKDGGSWNFAWLNKHGKSELLRITLVDAYEEYRNVQNINGVRASTLDRVDNSMKTIYKVFGKTYPIDALTYSHIEQYKEYWHSKHAPTTMNINLSKIRAFHNWCVKKGCAKKKIEFVLVREDEKLPNYLSEDEFNQIMKLDIIDVHFRRAFLFYYMTGCRKSEPFLGDLSGNWLTIKSTDAKSHRTRDIQLNGMIKSIVEEMKYRYHYYMDEFGQKPRNIIMNYGKQFKKACRHLGIKGKTLHSLRHTYAVRRWAITGDIKMVSQEIGHSSVVMTEKYAKFNLRKLKDDFPSIADKIDARLTPPVDDAYFTNLLGGI